MGSNHSVLVVEDSRFQAKLLQGLLEGHRYSVRVARNGREGLEALKRDAPSIILSDVVMPVMDGFEMCRFIKSQDDLRQVPIVLLTNQSRPQDVLRGLESGADSYITKPYDESTLLSTIERTLSVLTVQVPEESSEQCQISLENESYLIGAGRRQMLNFLLSAYRDAFLQNQRLEDAREQLVLLNESLEKMVAERTEALQEEVTKRRIAQEKLRQLAITDGLTKVFNHRYFMEIGRREFIRVKRYSRQLSLIMMDLDHFKKTNDTFGHKVGDQVLQAVAQICLKSFRKVDIFARIGGEEFAVLLPETGMQQAWMAAERLRRNVSGTVLRTKEDDLRLTLSLGVASVTDETRDFEHLLRMADTALYSAKRNGRDRVEKSPVAFSENHP
ncbi:MAG: diguanylate cyclase [Bacteroidetes bacterium]|nr:diguanylate cyclase [Bacteroidota bacterium]